MIRRVWQRVLFLNFQLFQRHRYRRFNMEQINGKPFVVLPDVFNPGLFRTGAFLTEQFADHIKPGMAVLDMGCGSGIGAIFAAQYTDQVTAVDINPEAVRCTQINALLNRVEKKIRVHESDLFAGVAGQQFDVVLFNPPFFRGTPADLQDHAWRSDDTVERFAVALPQHLKPDGFALVILSTNGDTDAFLQAFRANHLQIESAAQKDVLSEVLTVYRLTI